MFDKSWILWEGFGIIWDESWNLSTAWKINFWNLNASWKINKPYVSATGEFFWSSVSAYSGV